MFFNLIVFLVDIFDGIILSFLNLVPNVANTFISTNILIFGTVFKVTMYLYALAPVTVALVYKYFFIYFLLWLTSFILGIVESFIPRHHLVR